MHDDALARSLAGSFELVEARVESGRRIPLLGTIAAGVPLPAFQVLESIDVPGGSWRDREVFALRVRGTSMIDDGIFDGDYLVVERRADVSDGQTVIADVDGEVTVKRFYRERNGSVRLQPANDRLLPLVVRGERVHIRGVVVGVLRKQGFRAPARPTTPTPSPERGATDLAARILEQHAREGERIAACAVGDRRRIADLRTLAQSLRALHATYVETCHPRLRKALFDEATRTMRQLRAQARVQRRAPRRDR